MVREEQRRTLLDRNANFAASPAKTKSDMATRARGAHRMRCNGALFVSVSFRKYASTGPLMIESRATTVASASAIALIRPLDS